MITLSELPQEFHRIFKNEGFSLYSDLNQERLIPDVWRSCINGEDPPTETPLQWAVKNGHFEEAKALLNVGANPNVSGCNTYPPLRRLLVSQDFMSKQAVEVFNLLLLHPQINVNELSSDGGEFDDPDDALGQAYEKLFSAKESPEKIKFILQNYIFPLINHPKIKEERAQLIISLLQKSFVFESLIQKFMAEKLERLKGKVPSLSSAEFMKNIFEVEKILEKNLEKNSAEKSSDPREINKGEHEVKKGAENATAVENISLAKEGPVKKPLTIQDVLCQPIVKTYDQYFSCGVALMQPMKKEKNLKNGPNLSKNTVRHIFNFVGFSQFQKPQDQLKTEFLNLAASEAEQAIHSRKEYLKIVQKK